MEYIIKHIKKEIGIMYIIIPIFLCLLLPVVCVSANSISYDQLHQSYRVIHNNFIDQEGSPTAISSSFENNQNVVVPSGNIFLGVHSSVVAKTSMKVLNPGIIMTEKGLALPLERHTINNIPKWAVKSKFLIAFEVPSLIRQATQQQMAQQANGNFVRIFRNALKILKYELDCYFRR
jgi:hypothetical protein